MPIMQVNGVPLHYHVKGKGTPIVFIHPPFIASQEFRYQAYQLSERYKTITFDIRGHGHSGSSDAPLTFPLIVEDMKQLLNALQLEQAYVCGYSTGAMVALEALLTYPHRFKGGILVSGFSEISDPLTRFRILASIIASAKPFKAMLGFSISWGNADNRLTFDNLRNDAKHGDPVKWKEYSRYSYHYRCTDRLHEIKQPMLLVSGELDRQFRRYAHMMHELLPDSELYLLRGMKHQLPTKAPDKLSGIIERWIARREEREMTGSSRTSASLEWTAPNPADESVVEV
jgi:pimeloyl-ACP methyl ester carboxylesterase